MSNPPKVSVFVCSLIAYEGFTAVSPPLRDGGRDGGGTEKGGAGWVVGGADVE